ncbi:phage tail family protein [Streptomyces malaysiensis]|uniref:phage tail family protein n=1 Tax=Streptomyces malaysiensis TaxID=92644 RepID=UPI0036BA0AC6
MPIPAVKPSLDAGSPDPRPLPPQRVHWEHTFVSITGSCGEGEEIPLTGFSGKDWPSYFMQAGATGLDMPPFELHSDDSPNLDGGMYRGTRATQREIMLPVYIWGVDRRSLKDQKRKLLTSLNPKNGYCVLKFIESDGQPKYLYAFYKAGLEGNESEDAAGFRWLKIGIQMTAFDPWFYSDNLHVAEWNFGDGAPFLGPKFFPLNLSEGHPSTTELPVINPGDIEAWPVWEITGPVQSFKFTNQAGKSFGIDKQPGGGDVVASGRKLIIDTRPGYKTLLDDQDTNYYPLLAANPQLWSVPSGRSMTTINLVSGDGAAHVRMTLTPRYESY